MNNVDFDPKKFDKDEYGNLIPKPGNEDPRPTTSAEVEPDAEIQKEYGLDDDEALGLYP